MMANNMTCRHCSNIKSREVHSWIAFYQTQVEVQQSNLFQTFKSKRTLVPILAKIQDREFKSHNSRTSFNNSNISNSKLHWLAVEVHLTRLTLTSKKTTERTQWKHSFWIASIASNQEIMPTDKEKSQRMLRAKTSLLEIHQKVDNLKTSLTTELPQL